MGQAFMYRRGGTLRQFWGTPIGELPTFESVYMNVAGVSTEFIIVNQGLSEMGGTYDDSCDGTWLLMKDVYEKRAWDSTNNDYANSDIHAYLNSTFLGLFDAEIQSTIKQVKLPYRKGTGSGGTTVWGANGLSAKVFLLSDGEVAWGNNFNNYFPNIGSVVDYFWTCPEVDEWRIGYYNGVATNWALRAPYTGNTSNIFYVDTIGDWDYSSCSNSHGIRPALILPFDVRVDSDHNVKVR